MAEEKVSGKAIATGALAAGGVIGIAELIKALTKKVEAAPPGVQIVAPDEQTKEVFATALALLADISSKLDKLDSLGVMVDKLGLINDYLNDIKTGILALAGIEVIPTTEAKYNFRITDTVANLAIPGNATKELYRTTALEQGAIARVKLISTGKDIQYDLYIDNQRWAFNVSDMVDQSIELPHFPGAWIEKATGDKFVFMFSGGDSMQVRFWDNFRLVVRTTTDTAVTILEGEIVEKIFL